MRQSQRPVQVIQALLSCLLLTIAITPIAAQESDEDAIFAGVQRSPYMVTTEGDLPVTAEWIRLTVPENRADEDSRLIEVPFLRFPAVVDDPAPPIVLLADLPGPGEASPLQALDRISPLQSLLNTESDIIFMDPRGMGHARPRLDCPGDLEVTLETPAEKALLVAEVEAYQSKCADFWTDQGVDLAGYNAKEMAADIEALRQALGYEKISIVASGFGTHVTLALMRDYGDNLDRTVLFMVRGPNQSLALPGTIQEYLENLDSMVEADPAMSVQIPDFLGLVAGQLQQLALTPISVILPEIDSSESVTVALGKLDLQYVTSIDLGHSDVRSLPARYVDMSQGDYTWLGQRALEWRRGQGGNLVSVIADCASGASASRIVRVKGEAGNTLLGEAVNGVRFDTCASVGNPNLGRAFRTRVESDVPTLLISGSLDALSPVAEAEAVLEGLENGQLVVVEGATHDLLTEAPDLVAPVVVEFMTGDPEEEIMATNIIVPFALEPITFQPIAITGWKGEYFDNRNLEGEPVLVRNDEEVNFNWGEGSPAPVVPPDDFSARWSIRRHLPAGTYRLSVWVDDGVRIWVDDVLVIDQWQDGPPRNFLIDVNVVRGMHDVRIEFYEATGGARIQFSASYIQNFPDWKAEYFDNPTLDRAPVVIRNEQEINYFWGLAPPAPGVPADNWSGRWSRSAFLEAGEYTIQVNVAGGVRLWLDGVLLIDSWGDQGPRPLTVETPPLATGNHDLRVDYFKGSGEGQLSLSWTRKAQSTVPPTAVVSGPTRAQVGQIVTFDGGSSTAATGNTITGYGWNLGDGTNAIGPVVNHTYSIAGTYIVTLNVTDDKGSVDTTSLQILVEETPSTPQPNQPPQAVIQAPDQGIVGQPVTFDATGSTSVNPVVSYAWDFGDATSANAVRVDKIYSVPGTYNVILTLTDDQGLVGRANRLIEIAASSGEPVPTPLPTSTPTTGPPATPVPTASPVATLPPTATAVPAQTPTGQAPTPTSTQGAATPAPTPQETPTAATTPVATAEPPQEPTVTPETGDQLNPTAGITATVGGVPAQPISVAPDGSPTIALNVNQPITFLASDSSPGSAPIVSYSWDLGDDTELSNLVDPNVGIQHTYLQEGLYIVTLVVTDANSNTDSDIWKIQVTESN